MPDEPANLNPRCLMPPHTQHELANLPTKALRDLFSATLGFQTRSNNRPWMVKRISAASVLAPGVPPSVPDAQPATPTTAAIPPVGSEIRRTFHGKEIVVTVVADGFRLKGKIYRSLSAAATALCGGNRNGLVFFGLKPRPARAVGAA